VYSTKFKYVVFLTTFLVGATPGLALAFDFDCLFCFRDTLIIDGDTIYIERDESLLKSDSTTLAQTPSPLAKQRPHIWNVGIGFGLNTTHSSFQTFGSSLVTLNNFIGRKQTLQSNALAFAELGVRFASVKAPGGNIELALVSGTGINQIKSQYVSISNESQLASDSLLSFGSDAGELYSTYFTITEPPDIGEVDTSYVDLVNQKMSFHTVDVPLKLRVSFNSNKKPVLYFIETGVVRRFVTATHIQAKHYLLNSSGAWQSYAPSEFAVNRLIAPHVAVGAERKLTGRSAAADQQFFTIGASASLSLPAISVNQGSLLVLDASSFSIALFGRFFF